MPTARRNIQAVSAAAAAVVNVFTVAAATDDVISSIVVTETLGAATTFKIAINPSALGTVAAANAIAFNFPIAANGVVTFSLALLLATGSQLSVSAPGVGLTFTVSVQDNT